VLSQESKACLLTQLLAFKTETEREAVIVKANFDQLVHLPF